MNKPRTLKLLLLAGCLGIALGFLRVGSAAAASCSDSAIAFGRAKYCGYFSNIYDDGTSGDGGFVLTNGVSANNITDFVNQINADRTSGSTQDKSGADFIILTMLGYGAGTPKSTVTDSVFSAWQSLVQSYDSAGRVNYNYSFPWQCGQVNTYYQGNNQDDAPLLEASSTTTSTPCGPSNHVTTIAFLDAGGNPLYSIKKNCGNPIGNMTALPALPPPTGTIAGRVFQDSNLNGTWDGAGNNDGDISGANGEEFIQAGGAPCGSSFLQESVTIGITNDSSSPANLTGCNNSPPEPIAQPYYLQVLPPGQYTLSLNTVPSGWVVTGASSGTAGALPSGWTFNPSTGSVSGTLNGGNSINVWFGVAPIPAPSVAAACVNGTSGVTVSWTDGGSINNNKGYNVNFDTASGNFGGSYWDNSYPETTHADTFTQVTGNYGTPSPATLTFTPGQQYMVNIWYAGTGYHTTPNQTFTATPCVSLTPSCNGTIPSFTAKWPSGSAGDTYTVRYNTDNNFGNGFWYYAAGSPNPTQVTLTPPTNIGVNPGPNKLPPAAALTPGVTYYVDVYYNAENTAYGSTSFKAPYCGPPPAAPTVTQTCSGNNIGAQVSWPYLNLSGGNGWHIDITTNSDFTAGGWYLPVPDPGGSPTTVSATFPTPINPLPWGSGFSTPLTSLMAGQSYLIRVGYLDGSTESVDWSGTFSLCTPPALSCANVNPSTIEPNTASSFAVSFKNGTAGGALTGASLNVSVGTAPVQNFTNVSYSPPGSVPPRTTATSSAMPITVASPGSYPVTLTFTGGNAPGGNFTCPVQLTVGYKPYFKVYGGDVSAGNGFASSGTCASPSSPLPGIIGWNEDGAGGLYSGAGAQFGAIAPGTINGFATAQGSSPPSAYAGLALSFANANITNLPPASDDFGGQFGGTTGCIHNFFGDLPASATAIPNLFPNTVQAIAVPTPSTTPGSITDTYNTGGTNGSMNLTSGATLNAGQQVTLYVTGNVFIKKNITYNTSGWSLNSPTSLNLPSFRLIVSGNIYILNTVTQLDGLYVAQPQSGVSGSGSIYTCAATANKAVAASDPTYFTDCGGQLAVNGAFVANQVYLMRTNGTNGTISQSSSDPPTDNGNPSPLPNAAEYFNYTPELWIGAAGFSPTSALQYDSVTSLPPVL